MPDELNRYLNGMTAVLCLVAGLLTVRPFADSPVFYVFGGMSVGALLFVVVYLYQTNTGTT